MAEQEGPEHETSAGKPEEETKVPDEKPKKTKAALPRAKAEEMARLKAEKALAEAQEALEAAQAEVKKERQARAEAEEAMAETRQATEKARAEAKAALTRAQAEERARLKAEAALTQAKEALVAAQGEVKQEREVRAKTEQARTEAEEAMAETKKAIASEAEPAIPPAIPPAIVGAPAHGLTVSDVWVSRIGAPDVMTLILSPDEAFFVQASFQLKGREATSLTAQESSYEIKVYAKEMTSGKSRLLDTCRAKLVKDILEYTPKMQVQGLPIGLYRLTTLVTLHAKEPIRIGFRYVGIRDMVKMTGYRKGPILQVAGVQSPIRPPTLREVLPSR